MSPFISFFIFLIIIIQIIKRGRANCCGAFDKRCACDKWPWSGSSGNTLSYIQYIAVQEQMFFHTPFSSHTTRPNKRIVREDNGNSDGYMLSFVV